MDSEQLNSVKENTIDVHVHAGPSFFDRKFDAIELAEHVRDVGLGGFVLKSHFGSTFVPTEIATERVPDVDIFSSMTLNSFVGGLNPTAVELAIETGASVVWMPTFSAENFQPDSIGRAFPFSNQSLTVLDENGAVKQEALDVIATIHDADRDLLLGNGHLSKTETFAVLDAMEEHGFDINYLITHADFSFMGLTVEDQRELADRGAILEKCYLPIVYGEGTVPEVAESIAEVGAENCVLSTDHGQVNNPSPPEAYVEFVDRLHEAGVSVDELERMAVTLPKQLLET